MFLLRLVVYLSRRWGSQRLVRGAHPTNVQSRVQISVIFIGENEVRTASEIHYGRIDDA